MISRLNETAALSPGPTSSRTSDLTTIFQLISALKIVQCRPDKVQKSADNPAALQPKCR